MQVALSIAGSDPSGGAGIQADLKAFHQHRVYGTAVITLLTVQNTRRVSDVVVQSGELVAGQLDAVLEDLPVAAAKTGALGSADIVRAVAARFASGSVPLVVDPVMLAKHGAALLGPDTRMSVRRELLPVATIVTPNLDEAEWLVGATVRTDAEIRRAAVALCELGARAALVKGGHRAGPPDDLLYLDGVFHVLPGARLPERDTHGVGCNLSAAICARLALGQDLLGACRDAKAWVARGIGSAPGLGRGCGPIDPFAPVDGA